MTRSTTPHSVKVRFGRNVSDRIRIDPVRTIAAVAVDVIAAVIGVAEGLQWRSGSAEGLSWHPWLFVPTLIVLLASRKLYRRGLRRNFIDEIGPVQSAVAFATLTTLALILATEPSYAPGPVMIRVWLCAAGALAIACLARAWIERWFRTRHHSSAPTLIVGSGPVSEQLAHRMKQFSEYGMNPIGTVDSILDVNPVVPQELSNLGTLSDLARIVRAHRVEEVVVAFASAPHEEVVEAIRAAQNAGTRVWLVPRMFDTVGVHAHIEHLGGLPLMVLHHVDPRGWQFVLKGVLDRLGAGMGLLLLSPVFLLLTVLVRSSSPGPIFFAQERIGRDGVPFDCLKFRSMRPPRDSDADFVPAEGAAPGGVEGVDRRTTIGKIMRQTSLDELPQLINVLRGDMSLVGPRPERPEYVDLFAAQIRRYGERHRVQAGLTGWAQVHGLRGQTPIADRAEWDNYYIENWSIWLDIKIVFLTCIAVLKRSED
ncbi:sugar transferase [Rhodococcus sp. IEGM 1343]|uniref:sugar transferase n=1 Tax=Rhodococcus sp. IEGM 1343 TaxID=3082224 RepID=UPI002955B89E|nr:sugar transferase [Rhodococcus sp. IEGM 1343]MDV8055952.1 sugar transferase [Rhodococcus sp. IEGM 1343]